MMLADSSSPSRQAAADSQHRARIALRQIATNFFSPPFCQISKAYYDRAADKRAAVKEILLFTDPKVFLAASGYGR